VTGAGNRPGTSGGRAREDGREDRLPAGREPLAVCWNRADGQAYRGTVPAAGNEITNWKHLPAQEPNMTVDEWHECDEMLRAHPAPAQALNPTGTTIM
jgi:primary-amine oxidase